MMTPGKNNPNVTAPELATQGAAMITERGALIITSSVGKSTNMSSLAYAQTAPPSRKSQYPRRLVARGMLRLALLAATAGEQLARAALRLECEA